MTGAAARELVTYREAPTVAAVVRGSSRRIIDVRPIAPESWADLLAEWTLWMRSAGVPSTTVGLRRYYVTRLCREVLTRRQPDVTALTPQDLARWLAKPEWGSNTKKSARSTLRAFFTYLKDTGRVELSPAHMLPAVRIPRSVPKPAEESAYAAALAAAGPRERLAIMLAGRCGLRRGEVCRLRREDLEANDLGWSVRVTGKGGHVRMVPLPEDLAAEILARPPGWLFPTRYGDGHLTPHHLGKLVGRLLPEGMAMHSLRHRCATVAYGATRDLRAVQELLGHSRPETTAGYARVSDDAVRRAMIAAAT